MKVRALQPLRYKDVRYEPNAIFEIEPEEFVFLEPYVVQEELDEKPTTKKLTNNKKNYGNITTNTNRRNNENTTAVNENLD